MRKWKPWKNRRYTMASKWNFKYTFVLAAIAAFLVVSVGEAFATPVLVHQSREDYFSGGTQVTGCTAADGVSLGQGCTAVNYTIGSPTGVSLWEVVEKVFVETSADNVLCGSVLGQTTCTEFTYTV